MPVLTHDLIRTLEPQAKPFEVRDTKLKGFLLRMQPSGSMTFYVELGRGQRYRLGRADAIAPSIARDEARRLLAEVELGRDPIAERKAAKAHTLRSFVDEVYGPWATANIRSPGNTLRRLRSDFPDLQGKPLGDITPWLIEKWRATRIKAGVKATTINRALDDFRSALGKAVAWKMLDAHPLVGVKRSKSDSTPIVRWLDADEERRLRAALADREERARVKRDQANAWRRERGYQLLPDLRQQTYVGHLMPLVLLTMNTGLRRGEAFGLEWRDVDLDRAMLTVRATTAKSGTVRYIPLNAEAVAVLAGWRAQSSGEGLVFPARDGGRLDNIRKAWEEVLRRVGVADFRWHDLRHHFASRLVMAGVDLNTVRELLGHSSYQMTLRYAHLAPEHKAAAVAKLVRAS